jgi:hypothetical protein
VDGSAEERLVLRALAALVACLFAAGTAVALTQVDGEQGADDVPTVGGEPLYSGTGPLPGADVAAYVAVRTGVLRRVEGRVTAVVSFRTYYAEREARVFLVGLDAVGLLAATLGGVPMVVTGDLDRWAARQRAEAEAEVTSLRSMLETTQDRDFRAEFEAEIARLNSMLDHLDPAGDVVFGAVVVAEGSALRMLAGRADVRLVDVVARGEVDDLSVLTGLRPEETAQAGEPRTRPLPQRMTTRTSASM